MKRFGKACDFGEGVGTQKTYHSFVQLGYITKTWDILGTGTF